MRKFQLSFLAMSILLLSSYSWATAMSEERSKCYGMQSIAREYQGWKTDLHRFLSEYDSLSVDLRYRVSVSAMTKVVDEIVRLKKTSNMNGHDAVISDANRLISDINSGNITRAGAMGVLKTGLTKLEDAMDDIVYRAQVKNDCQLETQSSPSAAPATSAAW
jgi:hypothetical protein